VRPVRVRLASALARSAMVTRANAQLATLTKPAETGRTCSVANRVAPKPPSAAPTHALRKTLPVPLRLELMVTKRDEIAFCIARTITDPILAHIIEPGFCQLG
jgi:hypothetical protein